MARGIVNWGEPVAHILEDGSLYTQQARDSEGTGLVSILLEGPPNSGKTALAAQLAGMSDFPFVKVCTPDEMVGFTENAKCLQIRKVRCACLYTVFVSLMCSIGLFSSLTMLIVQRLAVFWWIISNGFSIMVQSGLDTPI